MANVFLAIQENLGREVALKVLNPLMLQDGQTLQRFKIEAQTAAKLTNPNIVTVYDVGHSGDTHYIAMEHLETSLRDRIPEKIPPQECLRIIGKIAEALADAHDKHVIHRDIKPDNIMFRPDGNPVLVDFGIARALELKTRLTMTGVNIGTPHYMSPEQCKGESIDGRSDIYSLGIVLYEMLCGKIPYTADYITGLIYHHTQGPVALLPEELSQYQPLIDVMMSKHKELRVADARQLKELIQSQWSPFMHQPPKRGKKQVYSAVAVTLLAVLSYFLFIPASNEPPIKETPLINSMNVPEKIPEKIAEVVSEKTNKTLPPVIKQPQEVKPKKNISPRKPAPHKKQPIETKKNNTPDSVVPVIKKIPEVPAVNFVNLPREVIAAMNSRLKRIEIGISKPGLIVGGSIELNLSLDPAGHITIKRLDDSRLLVNRQEQFETVKTIITETISGIVIVPSQAPDHQPRVIANWRKQFKLGTFKGKIILY